MSGSMYKNITADESETGKRVGTASNGRSLSLLLLLVLVLAHGDLTHRQLLTTAGAYLAKRSFQPCATKLASACMQCVDPCM